MCTQRHKNWNFWKNFEKQFFLSIFKKTKVTKCAIWVHVWSGRSGMWKPYLLRIFWDEKKIEILKKKFQAKFLKEISQKGHSGTYFHRIIKCDVEVVAWYKSYSGRAISILTHFWGRRAPKRCCTHQAQISPVVPKNRQKWRFFSSAVPDVCRRLYHAPSAPGAPHRLIAFQRTNSDLHPSPQSRDTPKKKPLGKRTLFFPRQGKRPHPLRSWELLAVFTNTAGHCSACQHVFNDLCRCSSFFYIQGGENKIFHEPLLIE